MLFAAWAELDFLHLVGLGGLFVLLFLFGFLVFVLAEIAHAANRRARVGRHLHEIEPVPLDEADGRVLARQSNEGQGGGAPAPALQMAGAPA